MGVRVTDDRNVALYDSVSGFAFSPVFDSEDEANAFLEWYRHKGLRDLRILTAPELEEELAEWREKGCIKHGTD